MQRLNTYNTHASLENFDIDYKISNQPGYVLIERSSDFEVVLDEQPAMLAEMSAFCKEADCRKVLILGPKTKVNLGVGDIHDLGIEIAKLNLQIAIVESHDATNEDTEFLENVMWNRGSSMQFFDNQKDARHWLAIS